jgi:6-phosphogluconolactonase (cycloisomerase 2 family)
MNARPVGSLVRFGLWLLTALRDCAPRRAAMVGGLAGIGCLLGAPGAMAASPFTEVSGSPFATGSYPSAVAFNSSGRLVAVADGDGTVAVLSTAAGGVLTPVAGSPFAVSTNASSLAFSPDGGLLAVADPTGNALEVFSVAADGTLSAVTGSPFTTGAGSTPIAVAFCPDGSLVATGNRDGNSVSVFSVSSGGVLTPVTGSPFATGQGARSVAFGPGGRLAVGNYFAGTISVFTYSADGVLTPVSGGQLQTDSYPTMVSFSPVGGVLAVVNLFSSITTFAGGAPTAQIVSPADRQTYSLNQPVATSFGCADPSGAPGIGSCTDSAGASGSADAGSGSAGAGAIDTSAWGSHSYTVTATSTDALTASATVAYTVTAPSTPTASPTPAAPVTLALPAVTGTPKAGITPAPRATGQLKGATLGLLRLGMTRAQADQAYTLSSRHGKRYEDFFSLTPLGVRVGYASDALLNTLTPSERRGLRGTVVLALTANPYYALAGIRPGSSLAAAQRTLAQATSSKSARTSGIWLRTAPRPRCSRSETRPCKRSESPPPG